MYTTKELYEVNHSLASSYLFSFTYPYEALDGIKDLILSLGEKIGEDYLEVKENVWIHKSAIVAPSAFIAGPTIIGEGTEIRHSAFIRGSVLIGKGCVIGNSVELKNVIISDSVQVPHFNYCGDSILGYKAHMGAGSLTSNVKSDKTLVTIKDYDGSRIETKRKKVGAFIGDYSEIGCNTVLNPGTIIGRNCIIYPGQSVRGIVPSYSIYKSANNVVKKEDR